VNPAEIVVGKPQAVGSPEMFPFLAEGIRQPRHAAHLHPNREQVYLAELVSGGPHHGWIAHNSAGFGMKINAQADL